MNNAEHFKPCECGTLINISSPEMKIVSKSFLRLALSWLATLKEESCQIR